MKRVGIKSAARRAGASAIWPAALAGASLLMGGAEAQSVSGVTVTGQAQTVTSPKYVAPLVDTPQTITIVDSQAIQQQNLQGLRDILSTLPGITFGAGEGGGGYGDSVTLRGFSANNDITVDSVRDSAQYTRSDSFNLEQAELVNGSNSVYGGAGAVGGSINLVTKRPKALNDAILGATVGTDNYQRLTLDLNRTIGESAAVRLNVMGHRNDLPGRDVEKNERWGIAPSVTIGLGTPTQATVQYVHQEDENTPQYGVPYALNAFNNGPLPGVDPSDYFGYSNIDSQESTVDQLTLTFEHQFSDALSVRNLSRWQKVGQVAIVDPPQGTFCLASGRSPYTGAVCTPANSFIPSGPRGTVRDTTNEILLNQTDFRAQFATAGVEHTLVVGVALSNETYHLDNGNTLRTPTGATPIFATMTLSSPNTIYAGPVNLIRTGFTDSEVRNRALYAFDRIELTRQWELNGGVRFERNEGHATTATIAAPPASTITVAAPSDNDDDLFSYRAGIVFKPTEYSSAYFAYGNAVTPSQSSVNGACTAVSTTGTANCNVDPEKARAYELGAKWGMLDGRLQLTAAVFRNERTNFRVASGDPTIPQQQLDGSTRVDGVALGATGQITDAWAVTANYTYLDSKILQNISDLSIAGGTLDFQKGDPLPNTPQQSFNLWTTYVLPFGVTLGYGASYYGEYTFNRTAATAGLYYTPDYWVHRAMASYNVNDHAALQLNVNNLSDETYYTRIRNNATSGWATPGDTRNATLSLNYRF